jgi:SAM-dependent methyltransferase
MKGVFDVYAAYYDLLYQDKDYRAETQFVHVLLAKHGVRTGGKLLELGCGTGKHADAFARLAYRLQGVDLSPAMVEAANAGKRADVAEQLKFSVGDVRAVRMDQKFDAVISLFHVASYQITNADLRAMFQTAAEHLKPGGVFLFDCWYGPAVLADRPAVRIKRMHNDAIEVLRIAEPVMHPNENVVDVNYTVQVKQSGQERVSEFREQHRMRYLFAPEVELLLLQSGMRQLELVDSSTGKPTGFESWAATFVAVKPA